MAPKLLIVTIIFWLCCLSVAHADEFSYEAVAKRFGETKLDAEHVQEARMHGECLVGLKRLAMS